MSNYRLIILLRSIGILRRVRIAHFQLLIASCYLDPTRLDNGKKKWNPLDFP